MAYTVRVADLERDHDAVLTVWRRNMEWWTPEEHDRRLRSYVHNPYGPNRVFVARHDPTGEVIGTASIGLRGISVSGRLLGAGCVVDFAVDQAHRTLRPGMLLARAVTGCLSSELPLIWGQPNHASAGVLRRAGVRDEGSGTTYLKVLHSLPRVRRRAIPPPLDRCVAAIVDVALHFSLGELRSNSQGLTLNSQSPCLASLLDHPDMRSLINIHRSPEWLRWAYENTHRKHVFLGAMGPGGNELLAYACCYKRMDGTGMIEDFVYRPSARALDNVMAAVVRWARSENCTDIRLDVVDPDPLLVHTLTRFGFSTLPSRPLLVLRHPTLPSDFRLCGVQKTSEPSCVVTRA